MKNIFRWKLPAVTAAGVMVLSLFVSAVPTYSFYREPYPQFTSVSGAQPVAKTANFSTQSQSPSGLPLRLRVPSINVEATIEYVGLTKGGAMDVPKLHPNVAWYSLGTRPGNDGSAVIAGHYSWKKNGGGGVFGNLNQLRRGDRIYIDDDAGKSLVFIVQSNRLYDFDADAREIFSRSDGAFLNLITCAGTWDQSKQSSTQRRVVFAEFVKQVETKDRS